MLFSPEMDELMAQIKAIILRQSENVFDEAEDRAALQNTIRIACEFSIFLKGIDGSPELSEAEYMADTIRYGIDDFYVMAQWGRVLTGLELRKGFAQNMPTTLIEMKKMYDSIFQQLIDPNATHSAKGVGLLLSLAQLMLLFMTGHFPSFLSFAVSESTP